MAIDRVDQNREDAQRIDRKEDELRRQNKARQTTRTFQVQYAAASQSHKKELEKNKEKETGKDQTKNEAESKNREEGLLFQIVQSVKADQDKESGHHAGQNKKDLNKKDEDKKDESVRDKKEDFSSKDSQRSSEGHKRVGESESRQDQSGSGQGQQGGGQSSGQQGGGQSGFSSDTGGQKGGGQSFEGRHGSAVLTADKKISAIGGSESTFDQQNRNFTEQNLDSLVESIRVGISATGNEQIEIQLNDPELAGIKVTIERKPEGLHVRILCQNRSVRVKLALERLKIYERLKNKNLLASRIDIE